jgi:heat shock protein HslJ
LAGVVLTTAVAATLAACAGNAGTSPPTDPVGTWGDAGTPTEPSLELAENGSFVGMDGCNRLRGAWRNDDGAIRFTDVASTLMACTNIDTWLSALATGSIEGKQMTVFDSGGAEIGKLTRGDTKSSSGTAPGDGAAFHGT